MYNFFKDTGIQFFGDSNVEFDYSTEANNPFNTEDDINLNAFAYRLFIKQWLPLSLDHERTLIRILYNGKRIIYSIDTTIREDSYENQSLISNDVTLSLNIKNELRERNLEEDNIFVGEFIRSWIKSIKERRRESLLEQFPDYDDYDEEICYKIFINRLVQYSNRNFIPDIKIMADDAFAASVMDTNVYIDLGNSRTIGLIVEKSLEDDKYAIADSSPLKIINYSKLEKEGIHYFNSYSSNDGSENDYDYLIGSNLRFKKNIFDKYPSRESFNLPSMVVIGSEADELAEVENQNPNTGLSGPKRYLWDDRLVEQFWTFHGTNIEDPIISGSFLGYLSQEDKDDILEIDGPTIPNLERPLFARYPKRTMMIFEMAEIIYQAFCQINSMHYRKRVGSQNIKRKLNSIAVSFPTAMPKWERDRLIKQSKKAVIILKQMGSIPYDIEIKLGSDEASCSQVAFVYGEAKRFPGQGVKFFNIITGCRSDSKLTVASLDIGGGTTDLMIGQYERESTHPINPNLKQKIIYSDGVNFAGDDILKHLISTFVIQRLRDAVISAGHPDVFTEYFGDAAGGADRQMRVEAMNAVLIPIAEFYMHLMVNDRVISNHEVAGLDTLMKLNDYLIANNLKRIKQPQDTGYFLTNNIIPNDSWEQLTINNLVPSVIELEKEVQRVYGNVLLRFAWVMSRYRPNYIILAGRTSSLPIISKMLKDAVTIPPSNIISLKDYFIGSWHPFSKNGIVNDPKTSVVVGNAISDLSLGRRMRDVNILTEGDHSDYTLNFIGMSQSGDRMTDEQIIYRSGDLAQQEQYFMNEMNIIYRNIDDQTMPCNLMYTLGLKKGLQPDVDPIGVIFDFDDSVKELNISSVSGTVVEADNNEIRDVNMDDIILRQQTLFDKEYYLDNGKFGIVD